MKTFIFLTDITLANGGSSLTLFLSGLNKNRMMAKLTLIALHISFIAPVLSQPTIQWQKSLGGADFEEVYSIQQTTDLGYIMIGVSLSNNGDVSGNHGGVDFWVVKLTEAGTIQWKKAYGGSNNDWPFDIRQTTDSGYIMTGRTNSNNGDVSGNHGDRDFWVVKLSETGVIQWKKTFGGSGPDEAHSIQQTSDGGYIVAGGSASTDGQVSGNHGYDDFWVIKLTNVGEIQWQKSLGGSSSEFARHIIQTYEGGFIVVGETMSNNGDVSGSHGNPDFWVVKLDENGIIEWQKALGGTAIDVARSICQLSDSSYVVAGYTASDVPGHNGMFDCWVVKLSATGEVLWQKAYGGSDNDQAFDIQITNNGDFILIGDTYSVDGDVLENDGGLDIWVLNLNEAGEIIWQKTLGGTMAEGGTCIQQTKDNGYVLAGYTWSNDGDVSENHGDSDFWVVKLSQESSKTEEAQILPLQIFPNPVHQSFTLKFPAEESTMTVIITNLLGRELSHQIITNNEDTTNELNIATLPNGLYLLTAISPSGKVFFGKVLKQE